MNSEPLTEAEWELLCSDERDADEHTIAAVERIVATREAAAATRARAEGAEQALREAWRIVHVARFDHKSDYGEEGGPDSFYNGVRYAASLLRADSIARRAS